MTRRDEPFKSVEAPLPTHPAPADVEALLAEAATKALYETETASGWYGQPECAEVGRIVAKGLLASPALATLRAHWQAEAWERGNNDGLTFAAAPQKSLLTNPYRADRQERS